MPEPKTRVVLTESCSSRSEPTWPSSVNATLQPAALSQLRLVTPQSGGGGTSGGAGEPEASLMGSLLKCLPGSQLQRPALELLPASLRPQRQRVWLTEVTGARRTFTIDLRAGHPYLPTSPHISLYLPASLHISPHLPTSPYISLRRSSSSSWATRASCLPRWLRAPAVHASRAPAGPPPPATPSAPQPRTGVAPAGAAPAGAAPASRIGILPPAPDRNDRVPGDGDPPPPQLAALRTR